MDMRVFDIEAKVEADHWWFVVRRKLFNQIISELNLPTDASILDIGTSTGTNLRMLKDMGFCNYKGLDIYPAAIRWCEKKGLGPVQKGDICHMPFPDCKFDLVIATDIIEHVEDDELALQEMRRVLKWTGNAILTVPAFQSLWGLQDDVSYHKRRYKRCELIYKIDKSGFDNYQCFYFNFLLFLPIFMTRKFIRIFNIRLKSENQINFFMINSILKAIFLVDTRIARKYKIPFGVSLFALIGKKSS